MRKHGPKDVNATTTENREGPYSFINLIPEP
jgi:hypothetical protein